jgi:hypothetical protein
MTALTDRTIGRRLLEAADTDIPRFLGFFTDTTTFRLGNNPTLTGAAAIAEWVGRYMHCGPRATGWWST